MKKHEHLSDTNTFFFKKILESRKLRIFDIALGYYLCKLPLGEDMIVPLPNSLNGHGGCKETISYTKNSKDDNENHHKGKACLH